MSETEIEALHSYNKNKSQTVAIVEEAGKSEPTYCVGRLQNGPVALENSGISWNSYT